MTFADVNCAVLLGMHLHRTTSAKPLPAPKRKAEIAALVEAGPDPERDGVVRWRRVDRKERIKARFDVEMHKRAMN